MTAASIVCQTITFGEGQRERFAQIFGAVANAGYAGVEMGWRHIAGLDPVALKEELGRFGLKLVASHVGGNLEDASQASGERQMLDVVTDFLVGAGCNLLMYSGLRWQDAGQFSSDVEMLNRSARRCKESGVSLLYHNHNWEFQDGGRVMNGLLDAACPELGLCPDLGWVHKGGSDPVAFLRDNNSRLGAVHFKDFASLNPVTDTVVLGRGIAPLREAVAWMKANRPDLAMIAEQDNCEGEPADAVTANAAFLREAWNQAPKGER